MKLIFVLLVSLPLLAFAAEHGGKAAEHGGKAAESKTESGKSSKAKEHAGKPAEEKEGEPADKKP
jgi:hypothetical protein